MPDAMPHDTPGLPISPERDSTTGPLSTLTTGTSDNISNATPVDLIGFALLAVGHSASAVSAGLVSRGQPPDEARRQTITLTAGYFGTTPDVVKGVWDVYAGKWWFGLLDLAAECHRGNTPETNELVRKWLARRGTPNTLVIPYAN